MQIRFSFHALERIKERSIKKSDVEKFIKFPDKIEISNINANRLLFKKIYFNQKHKKDHLLMLICEKENGILKIITIIDTSKISKYI